MYNKYVINIVGMIMKEYALICKEYFNAKVVNKASWIDEEIVVLQHLTLLSDAVHQLPETTILKNRTNLVNKLKGLSEAINKIKKESFYLFVAFDAEAHVREMEKLANLLSLKVAKELEGEG